MQTLPPLRLRPILQQYLWGGRRLGELLGKPIGADDDYAESWEVVDHPDGQSVIENGPLKGKTLGEVASGEHARLVYGKELTEGQGPPPRFPLLFKFLDAQKTLSVQVHPNDAQGARLTPPDLGKTEAWVVLAAEPGGKIYAGLKPGVDRTALAEATAAGRCDECLHVVEPAVGDCVFIPAGTVHALGAGLVIAEIQQASNTTFRLFDWNRVGKDGQPRPLHIEESLEVSDYQRGPAHPQTPEPLGDGRERLVACDKFLLDRLTLGERGQAELPDDDRFHLVSVIAGEARLECGDFDEPLVLGNTLLLPAARAPAKLSSASGAVLLDIRLP
ncbi:putative mannose-6-phosphate isomerase YvyI [Pseudobythopirellula maris]|uniref:Putative mannose-6-phosphate isomerase YvyI n=1 Tax=Pseudobythopirellula maris TaxID=2527991 RepID=A0A5C5ZHJ2_9BACT|nr:type I phosphomannose isomerase catalytic subunit [Pseudobythopirellula maris]TWT86814.1 putative mannose-6-phosphate isomerase YvyI [Pseudobythopirellula maris]